MTFDVKHFVLSHVIWIVGAVIALIGLHSYMQEHDARLLADQQAKISETRIADLQQQIAASDAAAAQTIAALKIKATNVRTADQAIAAIPDVSTLPLHATASPLPGFVQVDALALYSTLNTCQQDKAELQACTVARAAKDEQLKEKDVEIVAYKRPKTFWHRVGSTLKQVGVGIGIGIVLGGHLHL